MLCFTFDAGRRFLLHEHAGGAHYVDAPPTALIEPFSGNAARAILIETMKSQDVDSLPALAVATIQGSTEATFYVMAVCSGAVGIQRARHAVALVALAALAALALIFQRMRRTDKTS